MVVHLPKLTIGNILFFVIHDTLLLYFTYALQISSLEIEVFMFADFFFWRFASCSKIEHFLMYSLSYFYFPFHLFFTLYFSDHSSPNGKGVFYW